MRKRVISALLVFLMTFGCAACTAKPASEGDNDTSVNRTAEEENTEKLPSGDGNHLKIQQSDFKFTAEEKMSRLKAEYLIENNGYSDSDKIIALVTLPGNSLIEEYTSHGYEMPVGDYLSSRDALRSAKQLATLREDALKKLAYEGIDFELSQVYDTVLNGFAAEVTYGDFKKMQALAGGYIDTVGISDTYSRPQVSEVTSTDGAVNNKVDVYDTGIYKSDSVASLGYSGKKTSVSILDSGFDMSHPVFNTYTLDNEDDLMFTKSDISEKLQGGMNSVKTTPTLTADDVWYNNKIPYSYDYSEKDADVFPVDSEHGTHVAGIIGGWCEEEGHKGVAKDTQLVLMKVFPDDSSRGAEQADILAALEDSVKLGVDCINMSLGSSCGFALENDLDEEKTGVNAVYASIEEAGISLLVAASNSYSSAYGGEAGNTNRVTNPDSATVGTPSTYSAALSVASISGKKSGYLLVDGEVVFFNESSNIAGEENHFFDEFYEKLEMADGESRTFDYVTVPGIGSRQNYNAIDVKGKIALVRRGDNSFEDKAQQAEIAGAVAIIVYNNVEGEIPMSMGKRQHIPAISISKEVGTRLAQKSSGKIVIDRSNQAGPFMSDFSSWGPLPDLSIKPEITAHGGNIRSAVPGSKDGVGKYEELSGTSMATPNMCGLMVLVRQYVKENFPVKDGWTVKDQSNLANQLLMSTATIVLNQEGNPYSPRKQGAGLADLEKVVTTKAYLAGKNNTRSKIELRDDPKRTGVYEMEFSVVNISQSPVSYDLSLDAMTESVSTSDKYYVAEKAQMLSNAFTLEKVSGEGSVSGVSVTVPAGQTLDLKLTYKLSQDDKNTIESLFPYGMYVEGYVKLTSENEVPLNIPFLAFYGDWQQAPLFDKTYYEVESEAHNGAIDDEDKIKADYYATTPYGSYYYNYVIPLGTYLYDMDTSVYQAIPASMDKIAISDYEGAVDGIMGVYAGLLRNAKYMYYTITDNMTGEVIWQDTKYNVMKAFGNAGTPFPSVEFLRLYSSDLGLVNNREYKFTMLAELDYYDEIREGADGGRSTNIRNSFSFDFTLDNEAPIITDALFEKEYDRVEKDYRYYVTLTVHDNHYVQSVAPISLLMEPVPGTFDYSYTFSDLSQYRIPVYGGKAQDATVRVEITEYLKNQPHSNVSNNSLAFVIDDYALNQSIYLVELPGTNTNSVHFTSDGTADGLLWDEKTFTVEEGAVLDLTQYLYTGDPAMDADRDYLKYFTWEVEGADKYDADSVLKLYEGQVLGVSATAPGYNGTPGFARINVIQMPYGTGRTISVQVVPRQSAQSAEVQSVKASAARDGIGSAKAAKTADVPDITAERLQKVRFSYFDILHAHATMGVQGGLGQTIGRIYLSATPRNSISCYPGESFQLFFDAEPWYVKDNYQFTFESDSPRTASVDPVTGVVTALKEGNAIISLKVAGSVLTATLNITVNSEFVIESGSLVAYKGIGGAVEIPDDEGIRSISSFAFCQYDIDFDVHLDEDDYEANRLPLGNDTITSVKIPEGVEVIGRYAFYNCTNLQSVELPEKLTFIQEYAFANCSKLQSINLGKVEAIGAHTFENCRLLTFDSDNLSNVYAIGASAFHNCVAITSADLKALRNTGEEAFRGCTNLASVTLDPNGHTKLSDGIFRGTGLTNVVLYTTTQHPIPAYSFADCPALTEVTLPGNRVTIGRGAFSGSSRLATVKFLAGTEVNAIADAFSGTNITTFEVPAGAKYTTDTDKHLLLNEAGDTIILAAAGYDFGALEINDSKYTAIDTGAFGGAKITSLTIGDSVKKIGDYAFTGIKTLASVTLPAEAGVEIGDYAFYGISNGNSATAFTNLDKAARIGAYAFSGANVSGVSIGQNAQVGDYAFYRSALTSAAIASGAVIGSYAFANCGGLAEVTMPSDGIKIPDHAFYLDSKLATIDLTKVTEIGDYAFTGAGLTAVDLDECTSIGNYAFAGCKSVASIQLEKTRTIGDNAFSVSPSNELWLYVTVLMGGSASGTRNDAPSVGGTLTLPSTLQSIGMFAFAGMKIGAAVIPQSITEIPDSAFLGCASLNVVQMPGVKTVGDYAFMGCALAAVDLSKVEEIGNYAFCDYKSMTSLDLASAKKVGDYAFAFESASGTSPLAGTVSAPVLEEVGEAAFINARFTSFDAPALKIIGKLAFQGCARLTEFTFGQNIQSVGAGAFLQCDRLKDFYLGSGDDKTNNGKINGYAELKEGVLYTSSAQNGNIFLTAVPAGKQITTLTVAGGTSEVGAYAGSANRYITTVIFPDGLKTIGHAAFYGCTALRRAEFNSVQAPVLEMEVMDEEYIIEDNATQEGYDILHRYFNFYMGGAYDHVYVNFVAIAGEFNPITMVIPANNDVTGYDTIPYRLIFGGSAAAERSGYTAMEKNMSDFIDYAREILAIGVDNLQTQHASLVNSALICQSSISQNYATYGISDEDWNKYTKAVSDANAKIKELKLSLASKLAQDVQARINSLPASYDGSAQWSDFYDKLRTDYSTLSRDDKDALEMTKYNAFRASYESYNSSQSNPGTTPGDNQGENPGEQGGDEKGEGCGGCGTITTGGGMMMGGGCALIIFSMLAVMSFIRRRSLRK